MCDSVPKRNVIFVSLITSVGILLAILYFLFYSPLSQPTGSFHVAAGSSVRHIAQEAATQNHIRSAWAFITWYKLRHAHEPILAGYYQLPETVSLASFTTILTSGDTTENFISITFPEGITIDQMVDIIAQSQATIDIENYQRLLKGKEGYAFPDTYFVTETTTAEELIELQNQAMEELFASLQTTVDTHVLSESEIIILASIIEREANSVESMQMVSGILQNRLAIDMPLQADASIEYVLDKPLNQLTPADLELDSPYNTYLYRGLPPTPIGNPGQNAIKAVLEPTASDFFYYITDQTGTFHYARTLDEHNANVNRYLR